MESDLKRREIILQGRIVVDYVVVWKQKNCIGDCNGEQNNDQRDYEDYVRSSQP